MWTSILLDSERKYQIKYVVSSSGYTFYITDFVFLWEKHFSNTELFSVILENNPLLEDNKPEVISQLLNYLFESLTKECIETSITFDDEKEESMVINLKTPKGKAPFKLKLQCKKSTPLKFYEEITQHLLQCLKELKDSESQLFEVIKKKDAEINDYKAEGACLSLKHLETKTFNQQEHEEIFASTSKSLFNVKKILPHQCIKSESTPKHISAKSESPFAKVKCEMNDEAVMTSPMSSPVKQSGVAPLLVQSNEDSTDEMEESVSILGRKRRKTFKKQLNL